MPFQIETTLTMNQDNAPSFREFLAVTDASVLASFPECAGKTVIEVYDQYLENMRSFSGFIGSSRTHNNNTENTVATWESRDSFIAFAGDIIDSPSRTINDMSILYDNTPTAFLQKMYATQYASDLTITFTDIA